MAWCAFCNTHVEDLLDHVLKEHKSVRYDEWPDGQPITSDDFKVLFEIEKWME